MPRDRRISQFDGLRAFAFLAVFCHHAFGAPLLWMGVDLFFVLSGFLITRNLLELRATATRASSLATFFFRRVLRIVPPYYAALLLIHALTSAPARDLPWYLSFTSNIHDVLYGVPTGPLNNMWSIAIEEQFYLLWPWLILFVSRNRLPQLFVTVICAAALARLAFHRDGEAIYRLTICRMDLLASGALMATIEVRAPEWFGANATPLRVTMVVSALAFAVASVLVPGFSRHGDSVWFAVFGYGLSTVFFSALLAYVRGLGNEAPARLLRSPLLQYVGKVSYVAYLIHRLALEVARNAMPGSGRIRVAVVAFCATIALATLSWYGLEQPLQRLRRLVMPNYQATDGS